MLGSELLALRHAPVEQFAEPLIHGAMLSNGLGPRISLDEFRRSSDLQQRAAARIERSHPPSLSILHELITSPQRCRDCFAELLSRFWTQLIEGDWLRMRQHLQHDITRRGLVMSRHGPLAMLAGLSPNIRIDATDVVIAVPARSGTDTEQIELALGEQDEILLVPSHFTWPEVNMLIHKDCIAGREHTTVLIQYALAAMRHAGEAPVPPATLLTMLRAIADPTRMQILQLIVGQARSTREIAGLIGITEAAISKHLKLLQDAGWVTGEQRSYYRYHRLRSETVAELTASLDDLLR